jgi:SAM-dependent methyltransferase
MAYDGPQFYDDDDLFATYMHKRQQPGNANDTLERPVFLELVGVVAGLRILDLGCGDASFGREALLQGCRAYTGVEGSRNMVAAARQTLAGTEGDVVQAAIETWAYPAAAFDLVVSRLALHYVEDFEATCAGVFRTLGDGGRFVFSVEHPVLTSCDRGAQPSGIHLDWIVDDYFVTGQRVKKWLGSQVIIYHRTVEDYFLGLQRAGFVVESLRESRPRPVQFPEADVYARRLRIPLLLFLAGSKVSP